MPTTETELITLLVDEQVKVIRKYPDFKTLVLPSGKEFKSMKEAFTRYHKLALECAVREAEMEQLKAHLVGYLALVEPGKHKAKIVTPWGHVRRDVVSGGYDKDKCLKDHNLMETLKANYGKPSTNRYCIGS